MAPTSSINPHSGERIDLNICKAANAGWPRIFRSRAAVRSGRQKFGKLVRTLPAMPGAAAMLRPQIKWLSRNYPLLTKMAFGDPT
jgi:hypothetical protein